MGWVAEKRDAVSAGDALAASFSRLRGALLFVFVLLAASATLLLPRIAQADFDVASFTTTAANEDGSPDLLAGTHPYEYEIEFALAQDGEGVPEGSIYSLTVDLPSGLLGDPRALPRCPMAEFEGVTPHCRAETQVGVVGADLADLGPSFNPLYNLAPPFGYAAAFGFSAAGASVIELVTLRPEGAISVTVPVLPDLAIRSVTQTLWGVPASPGHDPERICESAAGSVQGCPSDAESLPFLSLPSSCEGPLATRLTLTSIDSPFEPLRTVSATALSLGQGGLPQGLSDCEALPFDPRLTFAPEAGALSPSGLAVGVEVPQTEGTLPTAAALRRIAIRLPAGLTLNPAAADGLEACAPEQIGLRSAPGDLPARFDLQPPRCPDGSKLGTASIETPLLDRPLGGAIYLARPDQNPFAALLAVYIALEDPATGTLIKLPGRLEADPADGRLRVALDQLPQLPFSEVALEFFGGPRALLKTPDRCGTYSAEAELVPSTSPPAAAIQRNAFFTLASGAGGAPCPAAESDRPNAPRFEAGSMVPIAGRSTPLVFSLRREDGTQHLNRFDFRLPAGLLADLSEVIECGDAEIEAARLKSGAAERDRPSCPPGSSLGQAQIAAGVGPLPFRLEGAIYLAGPYRGAPLSIIVVVPALAGPFDLGTLVLRAALDLDPRTARLSARTDPIPRILRGVPLELRSIALDLDHPGFIRNPTSCAPTKITGSATSAAGHIAPLSERFQVGACDALSFKPRPFVGLSGALRRNGRPDLRAVIRARPGQANIARAALTLPDTELLEYTNIDAVCTTARYAGAGGTGEGCPPGSRYGRARVFTPLLDRPLEGPVYLRSNNDPRRLPELVASLGGRTHLDFVAHLSSSQGLLQVTFGRLPDLPVEKIVVQLDGGRGGLLVNTVDLCPARPRVRASFLAHNRKRRALRPAVQLDCGGFGTGALSSRTPGQGDPRQRPDAGSW